MQITSRSLLLVLLAAGSLLAAPSRRAKKTESPKPPAAETVLPQPIEPPVAPAAVAPNAKVVAYGERDVVQVKAKLRYTTLIVLPRGERILDFTCGDKEYWIVNGNENFAYVKPAKADSKTNLNLVTASGNVFSFVLTEVSNETGAEPDLKVFVEPKEDMRAATGKAPAFVSAAEVENYRHQVEIAKEEIRRVEKTAQETIDRGISKFISNVRFPYEFQAGKKPFHVRAMYHDERFTYIQARPEETATLYEILDGKPNLVNFDYKNGVYVVDKVLERGYLIVGKAKLPFARND